MCRLNGYFSLSILAIIFMLGTLPTVALARFWMTRLPTDSSASDSRNQTPFQAHSYANRMRLDHKPPREPPTEDEDYFPTARVLGNRMLRDHPISHDLNERISPDDRPVEEPDSWVGPDNTPIQEADAKNVPKEHVISHTPEDETLSGLAAAQVPTNMRATDHVSPQEPTDLTAQEEPIGLAAFELPDMESIEDYASQEPTVTEARDHASPEEPASVGPIGPATSQEPSNRTLIPHEDSVSSTSHEQLPHQDSGINGMFPFHLPSQGPARKMPPFHIPSQDPSRIPTFNPSSQGPNRRIPSFQPPDRRTHPSSFNQFQTPAYSVPMGSAAFQGQFSQGEKNSNISPLKALFNWKNIFGAIIDELSERMFKYEEIELLDHYCSYFTRPYFIKWKIQFLTDVWCPGWTNIVGSGLSTKVSDSITIAIQEFVMKSQAEGLVQPDDVKYWYNNNNNNL